MRYLSLFSGYGGFELGIQQAYEELSGDIDDETERRRKEIAKRINEAGERLHPLSGETTLHIDIRSDELPNPSTDEGQPHCIGFSEIDKYATQIYKQHFNHKEYGDITKICSQDIPDFDLLVGGFPCQAFSIAGKRAGFNDTRGTLIYDVFRILKEKQPRLCLLENVKGLLSHDNGRTFKTIITSLAELGYAVEWQVLNAKNFGVPQNRERVFIIGHLGGFSGRQIFPIRESDNGVDKEQLPRKKTTKYGGGMRDIKNWWRPEMRIRRLTPTECERLMGLPDGWTEGVSDTQRYKLCGNGVVVNVVEEIIKRLIYDLQC